MAVDHLLKGKRLGLVTNHTGVSLELRATSQILQEKYDLRFLVGPEHGVAGVAQAGQKVQDTTDPRTGLPVISCSFCFQSSARPKRVSVSAA